MKDNSLLYALGSIINETSGTISLLVIFSSLTYIIWMISENKEKERKIAKIFSLIPFLVLSPCIFYLLEAFSSGLESAGFSDMWGYAFVGFIIAICFALSIFTAYGVSQQTKKSKLKDYSVNWIKPQ